MDWSQTRFDGTRLIASHTLALPMKKLAFPIELPPGIGPPAGVYTSSKTARGAGRVVIARYGKSSGIGIVWLSYGRADHPAGPKGLASIASNCTDCSSHGVIGLGHGFHGALLAGNPETSVTWYQNGYMIVVAGPAPPLTADTAERVARAAVAALVACPRCRP